MTYTKVSRLVTELTFGDLILHEDRRQRVLGVRLLENGRVRISLSDGRGEAGCWETAPHATVWMLPDD